MAQRRKTRGVEVGPVKVGDGAPVSVQSMANVDPHDAEALVGQVCRCAALGCDIFRLTVPDIEAAKVLGEVKAKSPIPLVADIHFDYRCALAAIEAGVDALRLNPGNIGSRDRVQAVVRAAKARRVPIRIGVNFGSLEGSLDAKVRAGEMRVSEALCESALGHLKILEDEGFRDGVISVKASDVMTTLESYRMLAERTDCPLHLGVTEAGTLLPGTVRNSVALGLLLSEGIGDTIRVSLTAEPEREVRAGMEILRSLGMRAPGPAITSCPTCGRTKVDLFKTASEVEAALEAYALSLGGAGAAKLPRVAVMGCVVNGPGEAKGADVALCGANGSFMVFVKGQKVCTVPESEAVSKVMEYVAALR